MNVSQPAANAIVYLSYAIPFERKSTNKIITLACTPVLVFFIQQKNFANIMQSLLTILFVSFFALWVGNVNAEVETAIPLSKDGWAFHRGNLAALTTVDLYIDLTCSSCRDSWPTLTRVYNSYKDKVHFKYHVFPLPYHQQAFITAKAAQVVSAYGTPDAVFTYFDTCYAKQPAIYNSATADMTYNEVVKLVGDWATTDTGVTSDQYYAGMSNSTYEMNARYQWKYTTLQGVYATPFTAIDGLKAMGLDTFADWQAALNPLVN